MTFVKYVFALLSLMIAWFSPVVLVVLFLHGKGYSDRTVALAELGTLIFMRVGLGIATAVAGEEYEKLHHSRTFSHQ